MKKIVDVIFLYAFMGILFLLLLASPGYRETFLLDTVLDFGHVPLFGATSIFLLWIFNGRTWPVTEKRYYAISFSATLFIGITSEILQAMTPNRELGIMDMARDALGATLCLLFAYPSSSGMRRLKIYKALGVIALFLATLPLQYALLETWRISSDFPILSSFEDLGEEYRWQGKDAEIAISKAHSTKGSRSLKALFKPGIYPGIGLKHFIGDWRGYRAFTFSVFLEGDQPLDIMIRINDYQHDETSSDRFNKHFMLSPGPNRVIVDVAGVRKAPLRRAMDIDDLSVVMIFSYLLQKPRTLYFDEFRLEGRK